MRGPCGPRKTLKAAQTVIIEISEPMFQVIIYNTECIKSMFKQTPVLHSFYATLVTFLGSVRTPHIQKSKFFFLYSYEG